MHSRTKFSHTRFFQIFPPWPCLNLSKLFLFVVIKATTFSKQNHYKTIIIAMIIIPSKQKSHTNWLFFFSKFSWWMYTRCCRDFITTVTCLNFKWNFYRFPLHSSFITWIGSIMAQFRRKKEELKNRFNIFLCIHTYRRTNFCEYNCPQVQAKFFLLKEEKRHWQFVVLCVHTSCWSQIQVLPLFAKWWENWTKVCACMLACMNLGNKWNAFDAFQDRTRQDNMINCKHNYWSC